jgi:AI-2 transport protein TqsA
MDDISESKELTLQAITLPVIVVAAGTAFLYFAGPILIPLVMAITLTYLLLPIVDLIKKAKIPHSLAVILTMLLAAGLFVFITFLLVGEISNLVSSIQDYWDKILETLQNWNTRLSEVLGKLGSFFKISQQLPVDANKVQSVGQFLLKGVSSLTNFVIGLVTLFFMTLFMLLESNLFKQKFKIVFGASHVEQTERILNEINKQLKGYILVRFYVFIALSIVCTIGLLILDVQYAYIWGPLAGLLNVIPYIGSIVGAIPPIIVAGVQHNSIMSMIYVTIFFLVVQTIEGNYITPKLTTTSVDLNAVSSLVSLLYWGWLWGGIGLLLAVPITAALKVLCDHIEPLRPIGILMGTERREKMIENNQQESAAQ